MFGHSIKDCCRRLRFQFRYLWRREPDAAEIISAFTGLWWSTWLSQPGNQLAWGNYEPMLRMANEASWAAWFAVLAFAHLVALIWDRRWLRRYVVVTAAVTWIFVAVVFASGSVITTAVGTYAIIGAAQIWAFWSTDGYRRRV